MSFIQVRDLEHGYSAGGLFSKRHRVQVLSGLNLDLHEGQSLGPCWEAAAAAKAPWRAC